MEKPYFVVQPSGQPVELSAGHLDDDLAVTADQMPVGLVGEMEGRGTVAEVDVGDDAELFESGQGAVDRRLGHIRKPGSHLGGDLFGVEVAVVAGTE
jgi:hypothetical protein